MIQECITVSLVNNRHLEIDQVVNGNKWNKEVIHFPEEEDARIYLSEFFSLHKQHKIVETAPQKFKLYV